MGLERKKGTRERKGGGRDTLKIDYCVVSYFLKLPGNVLFGIRGTSQVLQWHLQQRSMSLEHNSPLGKVTEGRGMFVFQTSYSHLLLCFLAVEVSTLVPKK